MKYPNYVEFKLRYFAGGIPGTPRLICLVSCLKVDVACIAVNGA
jgi:hypothetical protein